MSQQQVQQAAFQLKARYFPITVLKLVNNDLMMVESQLRSVRELAPNYFCHSPVVLDVTSLPGEKECDLAELCLLLRQHQMVPIGIQGLPKIAEHNALEIGLAIWQANSPEKKTELLEKEQQESSATPLYNTHVVTRPVRSGMHVYAQDSHLILLAPVHSGAECIADGDIHCYAPVYGRLLAGAKNNIQARIFCQNLDAELISIAGYYMMYDEYSGCRHGYLQVSLNDNHLEIANFQHRKE